MKTIGRILVVAALLLLVVVGPVRGQSGLIKWWMLDTLDSLWTIWQTGQSAVLDTITADTIATRTLSADEAWVPVLHGTADSAAVAGYADSAGVAGASGVADSAAVAAYADSSGMAGVASLADSAIVASYADSAAVAGYADSAAVAGYADSSATAAWADTAGVALVSIGPICETYTWLEPAAVAAIGRGTGLVFRHWPAEEWASGVRLLWLEMHSSGAISDTFLVEEWSDAIGTSKSTVDSVMFVSASRVEIATGWDDSLWAADSYLALKFKTGGAVDDVNALGLTLRVIGQ